MLWLALHFWLYGPAGFRDETLSAFVEPGAVYRLEEMGRLPVTDEVLVTFPNQWRIVWQTPCARYQAKLMVPHPWFELAAVRITSSSCAREGIDDQVARALGDMNLADAHAEVLILYSTAGDELVFRAQP